jgi:regulator of replication initiation timing
MSCQILALVLLGIPSICYAQATPSRIDQVNKISRDSVAALAQAQGLLLNIPDLVAENERLKAQVTTLEKELDATKSTAPPAPNPSAK